MSDRLLALQAIRNSIGEVMATCRALMAQLPPESPAFVALAQLVGGLECADTQLVACVIPGVRALEAPEIPSDRRRAAPWN